MSDLLRPIVLSAEDASRSAMLASLAHRGATRRNAIAYLKQWMNRRRDDSGLIGIVDARDCLHAIYGYHVEKRLQGEKALRIVVVAVLALPSLPVHDTMMASIDRLARERACTSIVLDLSACENTGTRTRAFFETAGFTPETSILAR